MINQMIAELNSSGFTVSSNHVLDSVIAGNTAIRHFFTGLSVSQLGISHYVPSASEPLVFLARDFGLRINPSTSIYLSPNNASYVGADHIAMLLASVFDKNHQNFPKSDSKNIIAMDIGTNTDLV
jgi:uncharacterized 2Fe-2S/4Fe-4S cluster protein (DUF4445 family)